MRRAAHRYGAGAADEPRWAIAGLLHDADYDRWPDEHPRRIVAWLRERGEPEVAQAVVAHYNPADVPELAEASIPAVPEVQNVLPPDVRPVTAPGLATEDAKGQRA